MSDYDVARRKMVEEQLIGRGISDRRVLAVMGRIPRHLFVDPGMADQAYLDRPLNIGEKQTISQPYMVAFMSELLALTGEERVLEIGTGSGYQTAVLAELVREVFSIERIPRLSNRARKTLYALGYVNVKLKTGDGTLGWPEQGPFPAILAAAGTPRIPEPLAEQLAEGGRLVMPCGGEEEQVLVRGVKEQGKIRLQHLTACRFVKLQGRYGWEEE